MYLLHHFDLKAKDLLDTSQGLIPFLELIWMQILSFH